ncbi:MAG: hypothetical protein RR603_06920, partial [Kurthia sp.]
LLSILGGIGMSFTQFFKRFLLPFAILTGALIIILTSPITNIEQDSETATYTNVELMQYHKKYAGLIHSIQTDLRKHENRFTVDFSMITDEKVEILIQKLENNKKLKPREMENIEKSINQSITRQQFDPATFQIQFANATQLGLMKENRLSYHDLMESIRTPLLELGVTAFRLDYEISPESTAVTITFTTPISEKLKMEIQQIGNGVVENNYFDARMVEIVIIDE